MLLYNKLHAYFVQLCIMFRLKHKNVVKLMEAYESRTSVYLVMQLWVSFSYQPKPTMLILFRLKHANIVALLEVFEDKTKVFLVMELWVIMPPEFHIFRFSLKVDQNWGTVWNWQQPIISLAISYADIFSQNLGY